MEKKNTEHKQPIYIETSVISYLVSRMSSNLVLAAYQQITREWWDTQLHYYQPLISDFVIEEISKGDPLLSASRLKVVQKFKMLPVTDDVIVLGDRYLKELSIPRKARLDAYHLAISVIHGMDFVLSWNFRHMANAFVRRKLEMINSELGIISPTICTPEELIRGKKNG
jgi:hypothetical protein